MATAHNETHALPVEPARDDRKTAGLATRHARAAQGSRMVDRFALGRDILRCPVLKQAGMGSEEVVMDDPSHVPVFFLDGPEHRRKRSAIARFFTPKAIAGRYGAVMEQATNELLGAMRARGSARLDHISWQLAVAVAGEIVGLTIGKAPKARDAIARRIDRMLWLTTVRAPGPVRRFLGALAARAVVMHFHLRDVRPAIRARRAAPKDDIISHLIEQGYSEKAILIECMTYSAAGMATTREFIVMVAWQLFDRPDLRALYLEGTEEEQYAILEEILRVDPIASFLYRRADEAPPGTLGADVMPGELYAIDLRETNMDEAVTGPCPHAITPGRGRRMKEAGAYLSFGDGAHRCPGAQIALAETRIFIDRLFRLPGIRLVRAPAMHWNASLMSYELRHAVIACNPG